jgi:hypothetical protein
MSQTEFGRQFGVTGFTIRQIENKRLALSPDLATQISFIYGVDMKQLLSGEDPDRPRLQSSSIEFRKEHYERLSDIDLDTMDARLEMLGFLMKLTGDAARKKKRFPTVAARLAVVLKAEVQRFGLEDEMIALLADYEGHPGHLKGAGVFYEMLFGSAYVPVDKFEDGRNARRRESVTLPRSPQSSAADKSPKSPLPELPQPGPGSGARKPSSSRRGRAPG